MAWRDPGGIACRFRGHFGRGKDQYNGCFVLINAFALHLSEELNRLLITEENQEPLAISKAKQFVNAHLEERITLESVATHIGVSPFYFCKLFKQAVGLTLTEYINRRRVEWAKRKLANPQNRITEVAYDVGLQSLSQFNRSFLRYVGESPTRFRGGGDVESAGHDLLGDASIGLDEFVADVEDVVDSVAADAGIEGAMFAKPRLQHFLRPARSDRVADEHQLRYKDKCFAIMRSFASCAPTEN